MGSLVLIILFIWLVVASNKKKKKPTGAKPTAATAQPVQSRPQPKPQRRPQPKAAPKKPAAPARPAPETPEEGFDRAEERAAYTPPSGSMPAQTFEYMGEGEAPEEHDEHLRAMHEADERRRMWREERAAMRNAGRRHLRSAVVMSEILDRPVSLREPRF